MKPTQKQIIKLVEDVCCNNCYQYWGFDYNVTDVWIPGNNELVKVIHKDDGKIVVANVLSEEAFDAEEFFKLTDHGRRCLARAIWRKSMTDYTRCD